MVPRFKLSVLNRVSGSALDSIPHMMVHTDVQAQFIYLFFKIFYLFIHDR